jgi:hypothetical protein
VVASRTPEARVMLTVNKNAWFGAWLLLGCAFALGAVSLGVLTVVPASLLAVAMSRSRTARESAYGALVGVGLLLLFVAWLHRDGTGLNPLPWLALGVVFVAGGFVAHRLRHH